MAYHLNKLICSNVYKKYINYLRNFYGTKKVQYKTFTISHLILRLNLHRSIKRFGN